MTESWYSLSLPPKRSDVSRNQSDQHRKTNSSHRNFLTLIPRCQRRWAQTGATSHQNHRGRFPMLGHTLKQLTFFKNQAVLTFFVKVAPLGRKRANTGCTQYRLAVQAEHVILRRVSNPIIFQPQCCLTSVLEWELVYPAWVLCCYFNWYLPEAGLSNKWLMISLSFRCDQIY